MKRDRVFFRLKGDEFEQYLYYTCVHTIRVVQTIHGEFHRLNELSLRGKESCQCFSRPVLSPLPPILQSSSYSSTKWYLANKCVKSFISPDKKWNKKIPFLGTRWIVSNYLSIECKSNMYNCPYRDLGTAIPLASLACQSLRLASRLAVTFLCDTDSFRWHVPLSFVLSSFLSFFLYPLHTSQLRCQTQHTLTALTFWLSVCPHFSFSPIPSHTRLILSLLSVSLLSLFGVGYGHLTELNWKFNIEEFYAQSSLISE